MCLFHAGWIILLVAALQTGTLAGALPHSVQLNSQYNLSWGISSDGTSIMMQLDLQGAGWMGIGWHAVNSTAVYMADADFVVVEFDSSGKLENVLDRTSIGFAEPPTDVSKGGVDNILSSSGIQFKSTSGVVSTATFSRPLLTNDTCCDHNITAGKMNVVWAYGSSNTFGFHGPNAGSATIDFFNGTAVRQPASQSSMMKRWHGTLMFLAFGILMPLAIFVSRFMKQYWWWLPVHVGSNVLALGLAISAFVIIVVSVQDMGTAHFRSAHAKVGLTTIILALMPPFWGVLALVFYNPDRKRAPIFPDMIHWWSGRIPVLLAFAAIFLGMELLGVPSMLRYGFGMLLGCYATAYLFIDATRVYDWAANKLFVGEESEDDLKTAITSAHSTEMYHSRDFS